MHTRTTLPPCKTERRAAGAPRARTRMPAPAAATFAASFGRRRAVYRLGRSHRRCRSRRAGFYLDAFSEQHGDRPGVPAPAAQLELLQCRCERERAVQPAVFHGRGAESHSRPEPEPDLRQREGERAGRTREPERAPDWAHRAAECELAGGELARCHRFRCGERALSLFHFAQRHRRHPERRLHHRRPRRLGDAARRACRQQRHHRRRPRHGESRGGTRGDARSRGRRSAAARSGFESALEQWRELRRREQRQHSGERRPGAADGERGQGRVREPHQQHGRRACEPHRELGRQRFGSSGPKASCNRAARSMRPPGMQ